MKRFISFITVLSMTVMLFMGIPIRASAEVISGNGFEFNPDTGVLTVTTDSGTSGWRGKVSDKSTVKEIIIGDEVVNIYDSAFYGTGITQVIIPNNVKKLYANAFANCTSLTQAFCADDITTSASSFGKNIVVYYHVEDNSDVTITKMSWATYDGAVIPNKIDGVGTVVSVAENLQYAVSKSGHDHIGGTFTCKDKAACAICGTKYGELGEHTMLDNVCTVCDSVKINETTFPDANFREYVISNDDSNKDGYLSTSERHRYSMSVSNKDIADLKGIEWYTYLNVLYCNDNLLSSLDVSKNTNLNSLQCSGNRLTSLDVSKNTKLTELVCRNNQLTSLDVSGNTALKTLYCYNNQITSLDLGSNTVLENLYCQQNQLTSLNVSQNTGLVKLWCQENQLASLDVSKNTLLKDLSCSYNKLISLDASSNTVLESLSCQENELTSLNVGQSALLTSLYCYNNKLNELNTSGNPELVYFECQHNQIEELDLTNNTKLISFDCSANNLRELNLNSNTKLTRVRCYHNQLTTLDLSSIPDLKSLHCADNQITSLDLSKNSSLSEFNGDNNRYSASSCLIAPDTLPGNFDVGNMQIIRGAIKTDENKILNIGGPNGVIYYAYDCGNNKSAKFTIYGAAHNLTKTEKLNATCEEDGNIEYYTCSECGYKFKKSAPDAETDILQDSEITIEALKHDYADWIITQGPNLTQTGKAERICRNNRTHKETAVVPALSDDSVWTKDEDKSTAPTESAAGKDVYTSEYGEVGVIIPKLEHTHTLTHVPEVPATEEADGVKEHWHCTGCDKNFADADGKNEVDDVTIPSKEHIHVWGDWNITQNPTRTDSGEAKRTCTKDSAHVETKTVPALSDDSVWTKDEDKSTAPTEEADGKDVYTSEYGEVEVIIPKLEHTHTLMHVPEVPATETTEGVKEHWHCTGCNKNFADADGRNEMTESDLKIPIIEAEISQGENTPEITLDKKQLIEAVLEEGAIINSNTKITLKVKNWDAEVSENDKSATENLANLKNLKVGQYLDISLIMKTDGKDSEAIHKTRQPLKITIQIPENLAGKSEYAIIRVHGSETVILPDLDNDKNTITFETDRFSTYALLYSEKSAETPTEKPTETPTEKPTEAPSETPTETPSEKPTEAPSEEQDNTTENTDDNTSESSAETSPYEEGVKIPVVTNGEGGNMGKPTDGINIPTAADDNDGKTAEYESASTGDKIGHRAWYAFVTAVSMGTLILLAASVKRKRK